MKRILFVCTGNTCRSSMAEAMLKERLRREGMDIQVMSAGTSVFMENAASGNAVDVMSEKGIDLSGHRSKPVTRRMLQEADLILVMTRSHRDAVLDMFPGSKGKVFTLKEYVADGEGLIKELEAVESRLKEWEMKPGEETQQGREEIEKIRAGLSGMDISDPFGGPVEAYRAAAQEIGEAVDRLMEKLKGCRRVKPGRGNITEPDESKQERADSE